MIVNIVNQQIQEVHPNHNWQETWSDLPRSFDARFLSIFPCSLSCGLGSFSSGCRGGSLLRRLCTLAIFPPFFCFHLEIKVLSRYQHKDTTLALDKQTGLGQSITTSTQRQVWNTRSGEVGEERLGTPASQMEPGPKILMGSNSRMRLELQKWSERQGRPLNRNAKNMRQFICLINSHFCTSHFNHH